VRADGRHVSDKRHVLDAPLYGGQVVTRLGDLPRTLASPRTA
jgi:hypothetical protein